MDTELIMDTSTLNNLLEHNSAKRVEFLIGMRRLIRNNSSRVSFRSMSKESVFEILSHVLDDVRWEVRYQCLLLISAIIQNSEDEVDLYLNLVLPKVVSNLGHENTNIRRAALQVLRMHMKYTTNLQTFIKLFIQHGLESEEYVTRKGCITSVGILFTSEFTNENLSLLIECLAKHFVHDDASLFYLIFLAMQKINELVGATTFESYLQKLDDEAVNTYKRVLNKFCFNESYLSSSSNSQASFSNHLGEQSYSNDKKFAKYEFGIFEEHIIRNIKSEDWKVRIEGIEHLKMILRDTPDLAEQILDMDKFLLFLSTLLSDTNFKIVILTLSIYDLLIDKFRREIKRFLRTFVSAITKHLGDSKLVVREHAIKVIHRLMHHVKPADVLSNLFENKSHRNQKLREEIVNRVTAAVLTFPSYSIEFSVLCEEVAPFLVDCKRRVRLAAFECFAVLAQAMGPARLTPLVAAVDCIELNFEGEGLMTAVQARLARRILPKCNEDGALTYAIVLPSSAGNPTRVAASNGADVDWIMAASGSSCSSTPPSRGNDSAWREPSASLMKSKVNKLKNDNPACTNKTDEEIFSTSEEDANVQVIYTKPSHPLREKSSYNHRVLQSILPATIKGSAFEEDCLNSQSNLSHDTVKTRSRVPSCSKIPILTVRNSVQKIHPRDPKSAGHRLPSPTRHRNSSPPHHPRQFLNSAVIQNRNRNYNGEVSKPSAPSNVNNHNLRKISPSGSGLRKKPILVRSPSLNQLQWEPQVSYDAYHSPSRNRSMGNVHSYFRTAEDVVANQPAPFLLDNDLNVIVLDDPVKVPSSPSPQSWPPADILRSRGSAGSCKNSGRTSPNSDSLPEMYRARRNSFNSAPASINQDNCDSPLHGLDISISKVTREKMLRKQQEILKVAEERRATRERSQQEHKQLLQKRLQDERQRQMRMRNSSPSSSEGPISDDDSDDHRPSTEPPVTPSTPPHPPPSSSPPPVSRQSKEGSARSLSRSSSLKGASRRQNQPTQPSKNLSQASKRNLAASSLALFNEPQDNTTPFSNPNEVLKKALKSLSTDTWMGKIEGIQSISKLAQLHPDILLNHLHAVVLGLLAEVKNLRSSVSRSAIFAVGELFSALRRNMEQDLDLITSTLLSKSGETVGFIREDIEKVMKLLIESVTPNKAALAIMAGGAKHRNGAVRKTAAHSLLGVVERMGAARILTVAKDVSEKLLPATAQFVMDGMPLTRYYGRRIFEILMTHSSFDKLLLKYVQPPTLRNISSILDNVRKKGAGEKPKEKMSARTQKIAMRRSVVFNRTM